MILHNNKLSVLLFLFCSAFLPKVNAGLQSMTESEMSEVSAQAGLTLDGVIKTSTFDNSMKNPGDDKFVLMDDVKIDVSFNDLTIDSTGSYQSPLGGSAKPAIRLGLPKRIKSNNSSIGSLKVAWSETGAIPAGVTNAPAKYLLIVKQAKEFGEYDDPDICLFGGCAQAAENKPGNWTFTASTVVNNVQFSIGQCGGAGANCSYTSGTATTPTSATWNWTTMVGNPPCTGSTNQNQCENKPDDFAHTAQGVAATAQFTMNEQERINIDMFASGGGGKGTPEPSITFLNVETLQEINMVGRDNSATDPQTGQHPTVVRKYNQWIGNPWRGRSNRTIASINLNGGLRMGGGVMVFAK